MRLLSPAHWLCATKKAMLHSAAMTTALLFFPNTATAKPSVYQGGSSDILQVRAEDAAIVARPDPTLLQIVLENEVYDDLWYGVLDGTFQYLQIEEYRFFVAHSPVMNSLFAYDWLNLQYEIIPRHRGSNTQRP